MHGSPSTEPLRLSRSKRLQISWNRSRRAGTAPKFRFPPRIAVSYLVARPSRDLVLAAHQQVTQDWWLQERAGYDCITSTEVLREAAQGDAAMSGLRLDALRKLELVTVTSDAEAMAEALLQSGVLPPAVRADALHLALASLNDADYLLTWNCRHLANANILKRLRKESASRGWRLPLVCTPLELMGDSLPDL